MSKEKVTIEIIKEDMSKENYQLISTEYVARGKPLDCVCNNGHECSFSWSSWKYYGRRCKTCTPIVRIANLTIGYISDEFEKIGYTLLSTEFENSKSKLTYLCDKNHEGEIRWNSFKNGQRCKICIGVKNKYNIDDVKKMFSDENYILNDDKYIDSHQKLNVTCPNNHNIEITLNKFNLGTRCTECFCDGLRTPYEEVKTCFENNGCKLLSTEYENYKGRLKYICSCGCQYSIGENKIKKYLTENKINYASQKTFDGLKMKSALRYDFVIDHNGIYFLLEFDGAQHFKGSTLYAKPTESDLLKNTYCIKNNIKLLRISYKEIDQVETILSDYIKNFAKNTDIITVSNAKLYKDMLKDVTKQK